MGGTVVTTQPASAQSFSSKARRSRFNRAFKLCSTRVYDAPGPVWLAAGDAVALLLSAVDHDCLLELATIVTGRGSLVQLVRGTVSALNQANLTGNYTVLRDLGSPAFREGNTAASLSQTFSSLREEKLDLGPILVVVPEFDPEPQYNENGQLYIGGYFPTEPLRVTFNLWFEATGNRWLLYGLSVNTIEASAETGPESTQ